jgi:autotransporter translocation and assembly factor TamB
MKKIFSYLGWTALALLGLLLIVLVGVGLFTQTERFRGLLRDQLVSALHASSHAEVSLGRIEGSIWGNITLHDVVLRYQDTEMLRVPRLTASYALASLLRGMVHVLRVEVVEPVVRLKQDAQGNWNVIAAFASDTEEPEEPLAEESGLRVLVDMVTLQGARLEITPAGEEGQTHRIEDLQLDASVEMLPAGLTAQVRHLAARLLAEEMPPFQVATTLSYQDRESVAAVTIERLTLDSQDSHLALIGEITDLNTLATQAELTIEKLATTDLIRIVPDWPLTQDLSGSVQITGSLADLRGTLGLAAADAQVEAEWQANLSQEIPQYVGTVKVARFDMQKLIRGQDLAGVIEGTVQAQGVGASIPDLTGEADLQIQALQVGSWQIGSVEVNGSLAQAQGRVSGKLSGDLGRATWQGEATLSEEPSYKLTLSVEHLDVKKVAPGQESFASDLNITSTVAGTGTELQKMVAQAEIHLLPSTIGPVEAKSGRVAARIADGRIQIAEVSLSAKDATLKVQGEIGTSPQEQGQLTYSLQVAHLAPWLSLVGQQGTGAFSLTGKAQGNIADLQIQGALQATALRVGENAIQSGRIALDLSGVGQTPPHGTVTTTFTGIQAGLALQSAEARVTLPQVQSPATGVSAQVAVQVRDEAARMHRLRAEASYRPEQTAVRLSEVSLELPEGTWQLVQPAQVVYAHDTVTIEKLLVASRGQQILLDGSVSFAEKQDLRLQIDQFALTTLRTLLPQQPAIDGVLSVQVHVTGTSAAPIIVGAVELDNLRIAGQEYERLSTAVTYREKQAGLQLAFQQDATHALDATGSLPLALSWAEGWKAEMIGDIDARVRSSGLSLVFLNGLSDEAVQDVAGELSMDVVVDGPVARPRARGTVQLRDGQADVKPLGVKIAAIGVEVQIDQEQVRIAHLTAQAREGRLHGSGTIALQDYTPTNLTVSLSANRWPAIYTQQYKVEIDGQVDCAGPLTAPAITGRIEVPRATLQPEIAVLDDSVVKRDETIVIRQAQSDATVEPAAGETPTQVPVGAGAQDLTLDLAVVLPRNIWVRHQNANIELSGEVRVRKAAGEGPVLVGSIETVRGWVGFQGRKFTLSRGQVVFTGEQEINPRLDIVAAYRFPEYEVETLVGGTAQAPTLTLRSEPELDQADILSLLLFGKPAPALGKGEQADLQNQALSITTGYAANRIGESVAQALGLEELGLSIQEMDLSSGRVGIGGYIGANTYVSTSQDMSGKGGREVSVEYHLNREWKVTTGTSADGNNTAGVIWHKQY